MGRGEGFGWEAVGMFACADGGRAVSVGVEASDRACAAGRGGVDGGEGVGTGGGHEVSEIGVVEDVFGPAAGARGVAVYGAGVDVEAGERGGERVVAVSRAGEEEQNVNGVDGRGGGFPREFGFVENDVGGSGDAADIAEEDVKGIRGVGGAAEVYGGMATGGMGGFGDVRRVGCGNGRAAEGKDGE